MPNPDSNDLSERELGILKLVATGASNKEIAQQLFISSNTVKVHLRNIFAKIGVASRTEAAMYAVRTGLVVHTQGDLSPENATDNTLAPDVVQFPDETNPAVEEKVVQAPRISLRLAPFILIVGLLGLLFIGLRLSPSLALFTVPTSTSLPPQITPTPLPRWIPQASLPTGRSDPAVVSFGDQIFVIGGVDSQGVVGMFDRYDPQTNTWSPLPPKPTPVYNIQAAVINGLIYIPGGKSDIDKPQPSSSLEIFDTNNNQWRSGADLPVPLSGYCLVAYEGELYVFGGWDGQNYLSSVFAYDPTNDTWLEKTAMPTPRAFCAAVEAGGKIYVMGGINATQPEDVNEIYAPARDNLQNNPWTLGFPIPESYSGLKAANIADTIYVFGDEEQESNRVGLIYFPQTNIWQSLAKAPYSLGDDFGMTSIGTNLFFIGGKIGNSFSDQNLSYQAIITLSIPIIIR